MLRRVFKRRFALIMACMILVGVLTPATTFAKTSKEKSIHSSHPPKVTIRKSPKTGKKDPVATIQEGCPPSAPINATPFNAGDIVTLTATLTSPDPDETSEAPEPLNIFDTNGNLATPAAPKVINLNKTASFTFTASTGDQLEACIVGYDGDETGTVNFTVTPATSPIPVPSTIWSGYGDHIKTALNPQYTRVDGTWKIPSDPCKSATEATVYDIWDGLGGFFAPLEQTGVRIFCAPHIKPEIRAFYETLNSSTPGPRLILPKAPILPSDVITATTKYLGTKSATYICDSSKPGSGGGKGVYQFSLTDQRTGENILHNVRVCGDDSPAARSSADWIVEGHGTLPDFDRVDFSNCRSNNGIISAGPIIQKFFLVGFQKKFPFVFTKASPSSLTDNGTGFTVFWKHS